MAFVRIKRGRPSVCFRLYGKQREIKTATETEARELLGRVEACLKLKQDPFVTLEIKHKGDIQGPQAVSTETRMTVTAALDRFEEIKETFTDIEMKLLKEFSTFLFDKMRIYYLDDLTVVHVRKFQDVLKKRTSKNGKPLSFSTANKYFKPIREFLTTMYEMNLTKEDIGGRIKSLRGTYNKRTPWTEDQFITVVNLVMTWARRILITMYVTGCRPIMLARLTWKDVDFTRGSFKVSSFKGGMSKTLELPMNDIVTEVFSKQLAEARAKKRGTSSDLVFPGPDGKSQFKSHTLLNEVKRKAEKAGVQGRVVPYALRNTFGTSMVSAGVPLKAVANLLGHEDTRTTEGYVGSIRESELEASTIAAQKFSKLGVDI